MIGAGFSGLDMAIKLKEIGMKFTILEKSSKLGGTWWDNQYPGAACDVPSHLYSLSYYLNPWWTRAFSRQVEIREYLHVLVRKIDKASNVYNKINIVGIARIDFTFFVSASTYHLKKLALRSLF